MCWSSRERRAFAYKVGIGAEEIRLMGTVIAVRAMEFTQMIVMVKLIIHRMETMRTDLAIIGAVTEANKVYKESWSYSDEEVGAELTRKRPVFI